MCSAKKACFSAEESREILLAGQNAGLKSKIHADEIDAIGGSELAGEIGAVSAEHLIAIRDSGIRALAERGTIACLLPATSFYLGKPFARARDLDHRRCSRRDWPATSIPAAAPASRSSSA